ncbi:hypothetical protein MU852_16825 [Brevundimonas albigilva]|uniref:hypothetical protein n=1 Tax=Brevundimonas albigilva TaxID=1312364 RepID=UPI00201B62CD|nr:hypothetical protein [Brevundimonas albigilva]UQV19929.1 hypothetical protein MU852_16825 [Brevundimonas albigilva]
MRVTLKLATSLDGRIATASGEAAGSPARPRGWRATACAPPMTPSWSGWRRCCTMTPN